MSFKNKSTFKHLIDLYNEERHFDDFNFNKFNSFGLDDDEDT